MDLHDYSNVLLDKETITGSYVYFEYYSLSKFLVRSGVGLVTTIYGIGDEGFSLNVVPIDTPDNTEFYTCILGNRYFSQDVVIPLGYRSEYI